MQSMDIAENTETTGTATGAMRAFLDANGDFDVGPDDWLNLNATFDQSELTTAIVNLKLRGELRMPAPVFSPADTLSDFQQLQLLDYREAVTVVSSAGAATFDTKYEVPLENQLGVFPSVTVGCAASDFFHFDLRSRVGDYHCNKGIAVRWDRMCHADCRFLSAVWSLKLKKLTRKTFLGALRMRLVMAPQFRPACAKAVYMWYGGGDVLDFCGGWGDRLAGACAAYPHVTSMTIVEPRPEAEPRYMQQLEVYDVPLPLQIHVGCAENVLPSLASETFDVIFTSPPYFDCEHYGDATSASASEAQSHRKFRKFDDWCAQFLYPVVQQCTRLLRPGGTLVVNINDVMRRGVRHNLCARLLEKVAQTQTQPPMSYVGVWGYSMRQRMGRNLGRQREGTRLSRAEPMYVWRKREA
jgi:hypothetical protein